MHDPIQALVEQYQQEWWGDASCVGMDPNIFFPLKGKTAREAKEICEGCAAQSRCLDWALETDQKYGVWGGASERERRRIKKRRLTAA